MTRLARLRPRLKARAHGTVDRVAAQVAARRATPYFHDSAESPPLDEHLTAVTLDLPPLAEHRAHDLTAHTLAGDLDARVHLGKWHGPDAPTIIFHHDLGDSAVDRRVNKVFPADSTPANRIAVQAPFHESTSAVAQGVRSLSAFLAMHAVAIELTDQLVEYVSKNTTQPTTITGMGLGGFITNLHHIHSDSADSYVPLLAGLAEDDVVLMAMRRGGDGERAIEYEHRIRNRLNFEEAFAATTHDHVHVHPLLARYDRLVRYDRQCESYGDLDVRTINTGHMTGVFATETLRDHVLTHMRSLQRRKQRQN